MCAPGNKSAVARGKDKQCSRKEQILKYKGGIQFSVLFVATLLISAPKTSTASSFVLPDTHGKIVAISMVKNEVDIIEAFVRHTLHFVDEIIVSDNGSIDGTWDILQELVEAGLPLRVIKDDRFEYDQSNKMTELYKLSLSYNPDFVMPLDADEFLQARSKAALRETLRKIPSAGIGHCKWKNYALSDVRELRISKRFAFRSRRSSYTKIVIKTPPGTEDKEALILQGNHGFVRSGKAVEEASLDECSIAHFPIRTSQQLRKKVIIGWMANVANFGTSQTESGFHWRDLYKKVLSGEMLKASVLAEEAYWYGTKMERRRGAMDIVRDPPLIFPRNAILLIERKSSLENFQELLSFVCRTWEAELTTEPKKSASF